MKADANLKAMSNIAAMQQVAANNTANALTNGFKASRVVQNGDKVSISQEARNAAVDNNGQPMSTTNLGEDMTQMTKNEVTLEANVNAIRTQSEMDKALFSLKK